MLLFHGLSKLRMHSETTRKALDRVSRDMCKTIRVFAKKTRELKTKELPSIVEKGNRRRAAKKRKDELEGKGEGSKTSPKASAAAKKRKGADDVVVLNLVKFKFHHHCNTAEDIRVFGPTDVTSTQCVSTVLAYNFA